MNLDGDAGGVGDRADVVRVRGDHSVAAADGPLDHRHVDNVVMARAGSESAGCPGLCSVQVLDAAAF
jgi:hypothetical protein